MPKTETICELFEVLETRRCYYVVMEKVDGRDLFELTRHASLEQVDAREILRQLLVSLKILHGMGRIHKDVKLENVMVDMESPKNESSSAEARVKLIDFDTVQSWEPRSPKSRDVLGTNGYIAPEAYVGQYSPASDMYCVGVIMYRLLT